MSKPPARTPSAKNPTTEPASRSAPRPAPAPATAAAKAADKSPSKLPPASKPPAPALKTAPAKMPSKTAPKTAAPPAPKPAPLVQAKATAFAPMPPVNNRFTDRFAPARPSKLPDPIEAQKNAYKADPKLVNAWKTKTGRELTEPELLAMPDSEYMKDKQIEFFRARLQQQKDDLLSNAGETTEHLREDTSIVPDPADRATIEEEHALELRTRDRERKLLKKVAQSLTRLETGEYGFCDETGEPIGLARLLARPTATLSLEAQQRRELKQKMFGD